MPNCIVAGCTSKKNKHNTMKGVILHVFPPNLLRIKMWLLQTGQDFGDLDEFAQKVLDGKRTDAYRLCSVHFTPQCYLDRASKKALRVDAVPTIFHNRDANSLRKHRLAATRTKEASTQTRSCPSTQTMKSPQWEALCHVVTDPHRIDEIRKKFTKRMLHLTMEIINLLTGEDYAVVKKTSGEHVTLDTYLDMSGGCSRTQSPIMETPPPSLIPEKNYKKILEVTNKITELLTGEVPITFQDVTVCFSMEESEYLEGHKDAMMENPHNQGEGSVFIKVEVTDEHEELYVKGDETCMDMDIPPEISTDPEDTKTTQRDIKIKEEEEGHVWIKEEEIPVQISADSEDTRDTRTDIKVEEEEVGHARIKEEEVPPEISIDPEDIRDTQRYIKVEEEEEEGHLGIKEEEIPQEISSGENYDNMETNPISPYESGTDDDITDNSSDDYPVDAKSNPAPHRPHLSPDPPPHETNFSDHSYPIPHHAGGRDGEEVPSAENGRHPHTCRLCEKSFSGTSALRRHEKTHKGEMPYYCLECGKDYLHKSRFISHRRIHTGEKPYLCSKCGKSFANKPDLVRHLRTHSGEKPFSCPDCGKHFTQRVHLVNHKKKHGLQKL